MASNRKTENAILRSRLPRKIDLTPQEKRRLIKVGRPLGAALAELISIVAYRTFTRCLVKKMPPRTGSKGGRPRIDKRIRDLIVRIAGQVGWGYARILGELKKLGLGDISKSTVRNVLRENGHVIGPRRGAGTWVEFVRRHQETLLACDFLQTKIWTLSGLTDYFLLFFMHVGSRRVWFAGSTAAPRPAWVEQQGGSLAKVLADEPIKPRYLLRDHDGKFPPGFDAAFAAEGVRVIKVGPRAPNMNSHMERWIQSLQVECLDHFIVFGERHLQHLVGEYLAFYNGVRPHQGLDNEPLGGRSNCSAAAAGSPVKAFENCQESCSHSQVRFAMLSSATDRSSRLGRLQWTTAGRACRRLLITSVSAQIRCTDGLNAAVCLSTASGGLCVSSAPRWMSGFGAKAPRDWTPLAQAIVSRRRRWSC